MADTPSRLTRKIEGLKARHAALKSEIEAEMRRPMPDWQRLRRLKSTRLRVKDVLHACRAARDAITLRAPRPVMRDFARP